jgi:hypothetical protein
MSNTNLLHNFFNSRSDASPLEASAQEKLEKEFQEWMDQQDTRELTFDEVVEPVMEYLSLTSNPHAMIEIHVNRAILWDLQESHVTDKYIKG